MTLRNISSGFSTSRLFRALVLVLVLATFTAIAACGGDDDAAETDAGMDSGEWVYAGSGGSGGGGAVGESGSGGSGGSGGTGGSGGSSMDSSVPDTGEGGSGGEGGVPQEVSCKYNNECPAGETCIDGKCAAPVPCVDSNDCRGRDDGRTICDNGQCVVCADDPDCFSGYGENYVCLANTCIRSRYCEQNEDCMDVEVCDTDANQCVECVDENDCPDDYICVNNHCGKACASDNDCVAPQLCDKEGGICVDCLRHETCEPLEYCDNGRCEPDVCAQGRVSCVENSTVRCTDAGDGLEEPVACPVGEVCVFRPGEDAVCELPATGPVVDPECNDGEQNGTETDVDCGGDGCLKCADGLLCEQGSDCLSGVCQPGCTGLLCFPGTRDSRCRPAECNDSTKNGAETDTDCGGGMCPRCPDGSPCLVDSDCWSDSCDNGTCAASTCQPELCPPCFITQVPCCIPAGQTCGCQTVFPIPIGGCV